MKSTVWQRERNIAKCEKCGKKSGDSWLCKKCKETHNAKQRAASARRRAMGHYPPSRDPNRKSK